MNNYLEKINERRTAQNKRNLVFNPGRRNTRESRLRRPRCTNRSLHLVMKSDVAKGAYNLRRHKEKIHKLIYKLGFKHGVRVYRLVNVGNHLHISLRLTSVAIWKGYISGITGGIASIVGFKKTSSRKTFWNARPYTRAVNWGADYRQLKCYFDFNYLQTTGLIPLHKPNNWRRVVDLFANELSERRGRSLYAN